MHRRRIMTKESNYIIPPENGINLTFLFEFHAYNNKCKLIKVKFSTLGEEKEAYQFYCSAIKYDKKYDLFCGK